MTIQDIYQNPALYAEYIKFENIFFFKNPLLNNQLNDYPHDGLPRYIEKEKWIQDNVMTEFINTKTQA